MSTVISFLSIACIIVCAYLFIHFSGKYAHMRNELEMFESALDDEKRRSEHLQAENDFFRSESDRYRTDLYNSVLRHRQLSEKSSKKLSKASSYINHLEKVLKDIATKEQYQQIMKDSQKWQDSLSK